MYSRRVQEELTAPWPPHGFKRPRKDTGANYSVSRERVPAPGCAPKRTSGEEFTGKYLHFVLIRLNAYCPRTRTSRAARE